MCEWVCVGESTLQQNASSHCHPPTHHHDHHLQDLGCHINVINNCQALDKETRAMGLAKGFQEGVLFLCVCSGGVLLVMLRRAIWCSG